MKLSIVIPVYNSEASLGPLTKAIKEHVTVEHEIIFVNDNSTDDSLAVLNTLEVKVINLSHNIGQQAAIVKGLEKATGDYVLTMDDDLQHNPKDIMRLYEEIQSGYDLVYGISDEFQKQYRFLGSKLTALFFRLRYPRYQDKRVSSFRIFTNKMKEHVLACDYRFIYISAIMFSEDIKIGQVFVNKEKRPYGNSGYNLKKLMMLFLKLCYYYGHLPETIKPKRKTDE